MYIKPTLVLDKKKCIKNISAMYEKAKRSHVKFRPHFKTHQSVLIGKLFQEAGVKAITVSSVDMAELFNCYGWKDITIAFPFNIREISRVNAFSKSATINLTVESVDTIKAIDKLSLRRFNIYIKIDAGYHRTGLQPDNRPEIDSIIKVCAHSKNLKFKGFISHFGNTYQAKNTDEVKKIFQDSMLVLKNMKTDYPNAEFSIGDTPSCSVIPEFKDIDEIRPGNFVFYDIMQYKIGSCTLDQIALSVACPVVSVHKDRNEIVIYGGAVHLSKDYIMVDNKKVFGYVADFNNTGWNKLMSDTYLSSLSQEHGIIKTEPALINKIKPGDLFYILPIHSCLTANLLKDYFII